MKLLIDMVFFGPSTTIGTLPTQRHIDNLIGFLFGKRTMGFRTGVLTWLAARFFRVLFRLALGEWGGLTFSGSRGLFQQLLQLSHSLLKLGNLPFEPGTIRTPHRCICISSHNTNIGKMAA